MSESDAERQLKDVFVLESIFPDPIAALLLDSPQVRHLKADCLFVLDTNALLAPYAVGAQGVNEIATLFRGLVTEKRLYVPARALREYLKNRPRCLVDNYDHLHKLRSSIPRIETLRCPMLEGLTEYESLVKHTEAMKGQIREYKGHLDRLIDIIRDWPWSDTLSLLYTELFSAEVVIDPDKTNDELISDLQARTRQQRPPGFKDKNKADGGIGDLIIWHAMLRLGRDRNQNVIFVSNEEKPDWVVRANDQVIATRPELVIEFHSATSGRHFRLTSFSRFLELLGATPETVSQAKRLETEPVAPFKRVQERLAFILAQLKEVFSDFLTSTAEHMEEHARILDLKLDGLLSSFKEVREAYEEIIDSPRGHLFLTEFAEVLAEITGVNGQLAYIAARMKRSGNTESERLRYLCQAFCEKYDEFAAWYLAGCP